VIVHGRAATERSSPHSTHESDDSAKLVAFKLLKLMSYVFVAPDLAGQRTVCELTSDVLVFAFLTYEQSDLLDAFL